MPDSGAIPPAFEQAPPAVSDAYVLAGWGHRVGAAVVDGLIVIAISLALGLLLGGLLAAAGSSTEDSLVGGLVVGSQVGSIAVGFLYALLLLRAGSRNGQTLGKQAMGIRVVTADGRQVTFGTVAVREWLAKTFVFGFLAILTLYMATLLNFLWPLWDRENRALHDMIASTRVVRA